MPLGTTVKRQAPPTHPTVWIGLGLAGVGLLVAAYAYTGTRVYDITFALVAILGGLLALGGILTAAWGRAVMSARAQRSRRGLISDDARKAARVAHVAVEEQPPTIAAPAAKREFRFAQAAKRLLPKPGAPRAKKAEGGASVFAFRSTAPLPSPSPSPSSVAIERLTLKCPECATEFTSEGVRPFTASCPNCDFAAEI